uniref:F-box domain-containing protein n=1 Tax=Mycena chlorophos TaxID=658473 RepID=A0ABQ0KZK3_MYCCL|nr:predicted protein [Mycena chlorophos]
MASLPPELIEAILSHVPDSEKAALKLASLVSPVFRDLCQKRLLTSLRLEPGDFFGHPSSRSAAIYTEAAKAFAQNPRLPGYVTTLSISLPAALDEPPKQILAARQILPLLVSVPRVTIICPPLCAWKKISREMTRLVEVWLSTGHSGSQELCLWNPYDVPRRVMHLLLARTDSLNLHNLDFNECEPATSPYVVSNGPRTIHTSNHIEVHGLLVQPEFLPYTMRLTNLRMDYGREIQQTVALCRIVAETLEILELLSEHFAYNQIFEFPTLPRLQTLRLVLRDNFLFPSGPALYLAPLQRLFSTILAPSIAPGLKKVAVSHKIFARANDPMPPVPAAFMAFLDGLFVDHPTLVNVVWVMKAFCFGNDSDGTASGGFSEKYTALVRSALPRTADKEFLSSTLEDW